MERGRPTLYREEYDELAENYCLLGATDSQLADFFDVHESTIHQWKLDHPSFSESIKKGKVLADVNVTKSLYKRATGCTVTEERSDSNGGHTTTKELPPDPVSAIFWLKNRQPKLWRDKQHVDHTTDGESFNTSEATTEELLKRAEASRIVEDAS